MKPLFWMKLLTILVGMGLFILGTLYVTGFPGKERSDYSFAPIIGFFLMIVLFFEFAFARISFLFIENVRHDLRDKLEMRIYAAVIASSLFPFLVAYALERPDANNPLELPLIGLAYLLPLVTVSIANAVGCTRSVRS